jgi:hypothetical protein
MSTLETNLIQPSTGTALTVGASGDTITVPSGATFNVAGTLQSGGSAITQGITDADQWRVTSSAGASSGVTTLLSSNWERNDSTGYGKIGSGVTQSSGVFTLPTTGIYYISFNIQFYISSAADSKLQGLIYTTTDNSNYNEVGDAVTSIHSISNGHAGASTNIFFDCTDTSTHKVKFYYFTNGGSGSVRTNTSVNRTFATFIRLGDT